MQRVLHHPVTILLITVGAAVFLFSLYINTQKMQRTLAEVDVLEQKIVQSEQEITQLNDSLNQSKSEFVKDKIIRNELLMQKPGEFVVQLPASAGTQLPLPSPSPTLTPWQEWLNLLQT